MQWQVYLGQQKVHSEFSVLEQRNLENRDPFAGPGPRRGAGQGMPRGSRGLCAGVDLT